MSQTPEQKVEVVKRKIDEQLALCDPEETPTICKMMDEDYTKVKEAVLEKVTKTKLTIGEAITDLEREFNPNRLD